MFRTLDHQCRIIVSFINTLLLLESAILMNMIFVFHEAINSKERGECFALEIRIYRNIKFMPL